MSNEHAIPSRTDGQDVSAPTIWPAGEMVYFDQAAYLREKSNRKPTGRSMANFRKQRKKRHEALQHESDQIRSFLQQNASAAALAGECRVKLARLEVVEVELQQMNRDAVERQSRQGRKRSDAERLIEEIANLDPDEPLPIRLTELADSLRGAS